MHSSSVGRRSIWNSVAAALCVTSLLAFAPHSTSAQDLSPAQQKALKEFAQKAKQYIAMEHALPAGKMNPSTDVNQLEQERLALRTAVQQARPNAKQGGFFTPEAAVAFRQLLAQTMSGPDGRKIRLSLAHAEPGAPANLQVNAAYPDTGGQPIQSVPPTLLLNLPVLPKGLEYSIAQKTLALRDDEANLVVDLLPNALP